MTKHPVYRPHISATERKYVNQCLDSTWVSSKGKFIGEFETAFADYLGVRSAASVCNGTVALHVALVALGIGPGDEVLVPTLTYIASVNAIAYTGATPVFVESRTADWQMDPADIAARITPRTRAIMAVHLYGHPCDMARLGDIAKRHDLLLIEDCAEAIGAKFDGRKVGTFGDIACFSFFGNKTITTGEGGMVTTNNATLDDEVRRLKGQGLAPNREYWHDRIGFNYRMTNICAAIGVAQMERVDDTIERKLALARCYRDALKHSSVQVHSATGPVLHSYWMVSVLTPEAQQREPLRKHLAAHGIETRPLFYPAHTMPIYTGSVGDFPVAEDLAGRGINLPSYPELTAADVTTISDCIRGFFDE